MNHVAGVGPLVLGLTGSIGMGKSTTAAMFAELGIPVHDSDAAVHMLYEPNGSAAARIGDLFPSVLNPEGGVDRIKLRAQVLSDNDALHQLEKIVHPLVQIERNEFLRRHCDAALVVLDIPLLFETGVDQYCDAVAVVSASPEVQKKRVLARPGMTEAAFAEIRRKQMPDCEKQARADFVIDTGQGFEKTKAEVADIVAKMHSRRCLRQSSENDLG